MPPGAPRLMRDAPLPPFSRRVPTDLTIHPRGRATAIKFGSGFIWTLRLIKLGGFHFLDPEPLAPYWTSRALHAPPCCNQPSQIVASENLRQTYKAEFSEKVLLPFERRR